MNDLLENWGFLLSAVCFAIALKHHYSQAGADELAWVLRPTAWLVECLSGISFEHEAHGGFVNYARRIVIAPSCAGLNFLIVAFCLAVFSGLCRIQDKRLKVLWLLFSLASVYGLSVIVNAVRIVVSIYSYDVDFHLGWLNPERMHRLQGVIIYFFFLCVFDRIISAVFPLIARIEHQHESKHAPDELSPWALAGLVPLSWYGLITLVVPLLNGALGKDAARFAEHGAMVLAGCCAIMITLFAAQRFWKRLTAWKFDEHHR